MDLGGGTERRRPACHRPTGGEKVLRQRVADITCREDLEAAVAAACEACREEEDCAIAT